MLKNYFTIFPRKRSVVKLWKQLGRQSLTVKVVSTISAVVCLIVGSGTFWLMHISSRGIAEISVTSALYQTQLLKNKLIESMIFDSQHHEELAKLLQTNKSVSGLDEVNIFDAGGVVRFSSLPQNIGGMVNLTFDTLDRVTLDHARTDFIGKGNQAKLHIIHPVKGGARCMMCHQNAKSDFLGGIELFVPLAPIYKRFMASRFFFIFIAVAIILVSALLIRWLVRSIVRRPIEKLVATMEKAKGGMVSVKARIHEDPDLRNLADAFNTMVEGIQTAQKQIEEQYQKELAQSNRLASLGQFMSNISHEIKNPLAAISSALHAVQSEFQSVAGQDVFQELTLQLNRIEQTVNNLLRYARQSPPHFEKCDIADPIREALHLADHRLLNNKIKLHWEKTDQKAMVYGDAGQLQQVFLNLFLNAANAMPKGGVLTVRIFLSSEDRTEPFSDSGLRERICVEVEDTGCGIAAENVSKIFDPFFTTNRGGTGLGLSVAKGIVENHKGMISVASEIGKGTKVSVLLPVFNGFEAMNKFPLKQEILA